VIVLSFTELVCHCFEEISSLNLQIRVTDSRYIPHVYFVDCGAVRNSGVLLFTLIVCEIQRKLVFKNRRPLNELNEMKGKCILEICVYDWWK
jgi:hypothetical protein